MYIRYGGNGAEKAGMAIDSLVRKLTRERR